MGMKMKFTLIIITSLLLFTSCKTNTTQPTDSKKEIVVKPGLYSNPQNLGEFKGELLYSGDIAPDFILNEGKENQFKLSDLKGKVVYLEFWRNKCTPCQLSIPVLVEKFKIINDKDFFVVTITSNIRESVTIDETQKFINEYQMNDFINIYDGETEINSIFKNYSIFGTPNGYLVNKEGIITKRLFPHDEDFISSVREQIAK